MCSYADPSESRMMDMSFFFVSKSPWCRIPPLQFRTRYDVEMHGFWLRFHAGYVYLGTVRHKICPYNKKESLNG